jgi:hypothetical protein
MAHPTKIQAYALAESEVQELKRRLTTALNERDRHYSEVRSHLSDHGPVHCELNNTDMVVTLKAVESGIDGTVSRPCFPDA